MTKPIYRRAVELLEGDLGDELVALDIDRGTCFGFNTVATTIWRSLAEPRNFEQLRDELLREYEVGANECATELQRLLDDLMVRGLVERSE